MMLSTYQPCAEQSELLPGYICLLAPQSYLRTTCDRHKSHISHRHSSALRFSISNPVFRDKILARRVGGKKSQIPSRSLEPASSLSFWLRCNASHHKSLAAKHIVSPKPKSFTQNFSNCICHSGWLEKLVEPSGYCSAAWEARTLAELTKEESWVKFTSALPQTHQHLLPKVWTMWNTDFTSPHFPFQTAVSNTRTQRWQKSLHPSSSGPLLSE